MKLVYVVVSVLMNYLLNYELRKKANGQVNEETKAQFNEVKKRSWFRFIIKTLYKQCC